MSRAHRVCVIGASWGGLQAVGDLVAALDARSELAFVIAQHRSADSSADAYVRSIQRRCPLPVKEADDKDPLESGRVYVAPADYHLLVDVGELGLSLDAPEQFSRPSVDVLFESAAESYGARAIGVVLTGANDDGARGATRIKEVGGVVYAQDPATAERREMPEGAIRAGVVDRILPIPAIAAALNVLGGVSA